MFASNWRFLAAASLLCLLSLLATPAGAQIAVGGDAGEVSPANPATWNYGTNGEIGINAGKSGTVTVAGGVCIISSFSYLGYGSGSTGMATITDPGSAWYTSGDISVGYAGTGTLNLANGGKVSIGNNYHCYIGYSAASDGTASITGTGSTWTSGGLSYVGYGGTGSLNVDNGGAVSTQTCYLGYSPGSSGSASVTGTGSHWTNTGTLFVGYADVGTGTLTVASGGTVTTGTLYASESALQGDGTINTTGLIADMDVVFDATHGTTQAFGTGGTLNLNIDWTGSLGLGYRGTGSLRIADGMNITCHDGCLGYSVGSAGSADISGPGSTWVNSYDLSVGSYGSGTLTVENGGKVTTNDKGSSGVGGYIGRYANSSGTVTITGAGSTWNCNTALYVGYAGSGNMTVKSGGTVTSGISYLGYNGGGYGSVVVTDPGSTWNTGSGIYLRTGTTLTIQNGGKVITSLCSSNATTTVTGSGSTLAVNTIYLGDSLAGTLTVSAGGTVTGNGSLGAGGAGSSGTAVVTGAGSTWTGNMYVGDTGSGTLTVEHGGVVGNSASTSGEIGSNSGTGLATVTGRGSAWNNATLYVGSTGTGTLKVEGGGTVSCSTGYLGYLPGSAGTATITGGGSAWANSGTLYVGYSGTGFLCVAEGGLLTSSGSSIGASSDVTVAGAGSTWNNNGSLTVASPGTGGAGTLAVESGGTVTTGTLYASPNSLTGDGTINAGGVVTDMDLFYDATHPVGRSLPFGTGGILNVNLGGTGNLGIGYSGIGSLRVADGQKVTSNIGYVGYGTGSSGTAVISGDQSTWTSPYLYVGYSGIGTLTVGGGGQIVARTLTICSGSNLNLHVNGDGMLSLGAMGWPASITNRGCVNLYANAFLAAGTYLPITVSKVQTTWSGLGSYNAYGGVWDSTAHTFTVAPAATSAAGVSNALTTGERLLITDSGTGKQVGASFGTVTGGTNFSAVPLGGTDLSGLPANQSILGAWNFTTNFSGDQALLSFDVGAGQSYNMSVWHYNGTAWTAFAAPDLTYGEDGIADFAVTSFVGGYALTAAPHDGDANYDGSVDVIDLGVLAKNYDSTGLPCGSGQSWGLADFNDDGNVDVIDLGILAKNYDWSGASAGAVPEPCSLALLALGGLALLRRRGL